MPLTFLDLKQSDRLLEIASACPDSERFKSVLNSAVSGLMIRGDFQNLLTPIQVCVYNGCITWPRCIAAIRTASICGEPVRVRNLWFEYLERGCGCNGGTVLSDFGRSPTYNDVTGQFKYLRVYLQRNEDVGKKVTLYGLDEYGQIIRTKDATGEWQEGVTLTLAKPFVGTPMRFQGNPSRVRKERTAGPLWLYEYDAETDKIRDLAQYQPSETEPMYRRQKLRGASSCRSCAEDCRIVIRALVKERFVPVELDTDIVQLAEWENLEAIKLMMQSRIEMDGRNKRVADDLEMAAIRELNLWDRNQQPEDTFVVSTNIMGESWRSARIGL